MDEALRNIALVSDGAVMALRERVGGSHEHSAPTSTLSGLIDELGGRFQGCRTHRARLAVIKEAQSTSDRLRYAPDRSRIAGTPEWRTAIGQDPRSCRVLAEVYGISHMTVARIKKAARRGL